MSRVQALLMGGQACVLYGAAEFSRDMDFAVLCEPDNLDNLRAALGELQAENIAVPTFDADYLQRGHAVHFRCRHPEAAGLRVDVMSLMRGVAPFAELWERRTSLLTPDEETLELLSLPDLVNAKKTQRDKDWPMIRRLVEENYFSFRDAPTPERIAFWLRELRTPSLLRELIVRYPTEAGRWRTLRPVIDAAISGDEPTVEAALYAEERTEREQDRLYWQPLRAELESLRHARR